jgi:hypothetical protein
LLSEEKLSACEPELMNFIRTIQQFLFGLAECF